MGGLQCDYEIRALGMMMMSFRLLGQVHHDMFLDTVRVAVEDFGSW